VSSLVDSFGITNFNQLYNMSTHATEEDLDKYFSQTEKHLEIDRVLACFKLDPFAILELPYSKPDPKTIKMAYRKKSLMIHPDKVKHEHAQDAFALIKKAESELTDEARLKFLLTVIEEARVEVLRDNGHKVKTEVVVNAPTMTENTEGGAPRLKASLDSITIVDEKEYPYLQTSQGQAQVKEKMKEILIEMELRKRRQMKKEMEAEGAEKRKAEQVVNERKRKQEDAKQWEASRDTRVNSWRDFQKKGGKKVKKIRKSGL
jgi:DnaJ family protein C protein 8